MLVEFQLDFKLLILNANPIASLNAWSNPLVHKPKSVKFDNPLFTVRPCDHKVRSGGNFV